MATLHTGDCAACHRYAGVLTEAAPEVGAWSGRIILVAHRTDRLDLRRLRDAGVRVVEDPKRVMVVDEASVAIADEWGEIFFAVAADDIHSLPSADEIADWVRFISIQCPECEAPEGEWRAL